DMNRDQLLGVRVPLLPNTEVSDGARLIRHDIGVALMMPQRQARRIIRKCKQASSLVQCELAVIGDFRTAEARELVFVDDTGRGGWCHRPGPPFGRSIPSSRSARYKARHSCADNLDASYLSPRAATRRAAETRIRVEIPESAAVEAPRQPSMRPASRRPQARG